ncbi:MAG: efflux RND transporter permease subunit [Phycisphaerales bacterium]|nr:MAG: efflux RND transporter permease subunit [Phycisphaerales bacterium]
MNFLKTAIDQPITVAVCVILVIMAGLISLTRVPIQLTPNVDDTVIAVTTRWEGASPDEIEKEIIDKQEEQLQGVTNLRQMTSVSSQGQGQITLEFHVGTRKESALQEVSDKLRQVPSYPQNVDEPVIDASDPSNRDYIAWIMFETDDPDFEISTLQDFAEDRIKPIFERVAGMSEINVLGGREREVQIRFDPIRLAQHRITATQLVDAIQRANRNVSAGELVEGKLDVRVRTIGQFESTEQIEQTVITHTARGPIRIGDIAEVVESYKRPNRLVRSRGERVIAINAQREVGSNVMEVMAGLQREIDRLNAEGGLLDTYSEQIGLSSPLRLRQVYDQTSYIDDALALVRNNIWIGGSLAILVLLIFLRSLRSVGIIALAIPISVIGSVVVMVMLGRSVNVISLAGMAFAVGMVVDNAIVVLENIFRHLEMGKKAMKAAYDGAREVAGAILASTLTTIAVFVPILLVQEEAGQLFRDIALAICAAIALSLLVSITVIPTASARLLKPIKRREPIDRSGRSRFQRVVMAPIDAAFAIGRAVGSIPRLWGWVIHWLCGSVIARVTIVAVLTGVSLFGSWWLMPPADYLPQGNRNLIFGILNPPPGYNLEQQSRLGERIEATMRPFWEAGKLKHDPEAYETAVAELPEIPTFNPRLGRPGDPVVPPSIENYFFVATPTTMFHGAISDDPGRVADLQPLFRHATRQDVAPGVLSFAFQVPLFRLGGNTGSAVKVDFSGDDLDRVIAAAGAVYDEMVERYGPFTVQTEPNNFNIQGPELQIIPDRIRLSELGMTTADLGIAVQAAGDGAIIGEYRLGGETIDLKLVARDSATMRQLAGIDDTPIAAPTGDVVPLTSVAMLERTTAPQEILRVGRQRAVSLQFTAPEGMPLETAIAEINGILADYRGQGVLTPDVEVNVAGSASKLEAVRNALLGDGSFTGTLGSSLVLALIIVYLLMCVLFQSFVHPLVIMFSVPLATLGGFAALAIVHVWSQANPYLPVQNLDVLTMLGFVILIGVVVNNAILIVHQSLNFMRGAGDAAEDIDGVLEPRRAISEAVRTRVRPIFMSMLTSVGAMLPLVLMPGSGSELYRGLGSVVVGGLIVSSLFTLLLVPLLFSLVIDAAQALASRTKPHLAESLGVPEPTPARSGSVGSTAGATMRRSPRT